MKNFLNFFGLNQKAPSTQINKSTHSEVLLEKITNQPLIHNREINDDNKLIKVNSMKEVELGPQWAGSAQKKGKLFGIVNAVFFPR